MIRTVAEMWPDHDGHTIVYSEHGRTDYILNSLELVDEFETEGVRFQGWSVNDFDATPHDSDVHETEVWCRTCCIELSTETEMDSMTPIQRLNEIVGEHGPDNEVEFRDLAEIGTICLIERNVRNGEVYVTLHERVDDAVQAHFNQEYAQDWYLVDLIDLATGQQFEPTHSARAKGRP